MSIVTLGPENNRKFPLTPLSHIHGPDLSSVFTETEPVLIAGYHPESTAPSSINSCVLYPMCLTMYCDIYLQLQSCTESLKIPQCGAQLFGEVTALQQDQSSVLTTHMEWPTTVCKFSSNRIPCIWPPWVHMYILTGRHTHTRIIKINIFKSPACPPLIPHPWLLAEIDHTSTSVRMSGLESHSTEHFRIISLSLLSWALTVHLFCYGMIFPCCLSMVSLSIRLPTLKCPSVVSKNLAAWTFWCRLSWLVNSIESMPRVPITGS